MPKPATLQKAQLIEMAPDLQNPASDGKSVNVQFNPETLKVTYANQVAEQKNKNAQTGTAALQHVGKGTTKLAVQLWFDVNHPATGDQRPRDVRELTGQVAYFIEPNGKGQPEGSFVIPALKFRWGAFSFVGVMEALEETIELFSNDGRPLRASVSFSLTQQEIVAFKTKAPFKLPATATFSGGKPVGTRPLTAAPAGASLPGLAEAAGGGASWQDIAAANGIENPRLLAPGQLVDLHARVRI